MTAVTAAPGARPVGRERYHGPRIEVVVPVYNEAEVLERSIRRLHRFLRASMPFEWRIVIGDNASTDQTWPLAQRMRAELDGVDALRLEQKGRGRALRAAWLASDAEILCYMDADLSTDLRALLPLIAALASGHSDLAIGTRLGPGARIVRSRKRELISRAYNSLLHAVLRAHFSDAQCGFKAIRAETARRLLPGVADNGWFFDTELLILAQRRGLRIHEVAVDWDEDADSRVDIIATALGDLRGIARLVLQSPISRFLLIGAISTVVYAVCYLLLRAPVGAGAANALALALTAVANTHANRRYTFGVQGRTSLVRQHAAWALVFLLALALTDGALHLVAAIDPHPARAVEVVILIAASACATVTRYVALRSWVFARHRAGSNRLRPAAYRNRNRQAGTPAG